MNIERIPGVVQILEPRGRGDASPRLPAAGETVLLTLDESGAGNIFATTAAGVSLRLTGLEVLNRELQPGETLAARVVASHPVLELELYNARPEATPVDARPLTLSDYPAMRLDLAELRTIVWQAPTAAALASSWQAQATDRFLFPVYVWSGVRWGAMQMSLMLIVPEAPPRRGPPRRRRSALRMELTHPTLGWIVFEVEWRSGGIHLTFAAEESVVQALRGAVSSIAAALRRANLRLTGVRMTRGRAPAARQFAPSLRQPPPRNDGPEGRLFRAAAETAVALLNPENQRY